MSKYAVGVDVGATKVAIATIGEDYSVHQKQEVLTHAENGEKLWTNIQEVISRFMRSESGSLLGIGVASAGPLDIPKAVAKEKKGGPKKEEKKEIQSSSYWYTGHQRN